MLKNMLTRTCLTIAAIATLAACGATLSDVVQTKQRGGGTAQMYAVPPQVAFDVARRVLRSEGADQIEEHAAEGYMLSSVGYNATFQGCFVGVWIEWAPPSPYTRVTVVTKRKSSTDFVTGLTEETFQRDFATALAQAPAPQPPPLAR